ncbi:SDR family NAD(P)-dependent oxidoreductase [Larkinella sp. VNQ87]|uniref:SDR family NAD(P)-dependent oxidoreductase n=1 Tax=Larkinella sp. VNQ87 TaxID=3400921 RepID=UPI003C0DF8FF
MKTSKIALVTGGSRGIGKNIALSLAQKGIQVVLTYHSNQAEAQATVAEIEALGQKAVALPLNVADSSSFGAFSQQVIAALQTGFDIDRFDFLINNAGTSLSAPIAETTEAQTDTPAMREFVASITALGRVGLPDDVGGVVAFLCSEEAKWVNGQRIEVTGGMNL